MRAAPGTVVSVLGQRPAADHAHAFRHGNSIDQLKEWVSVDRMCGRWLTAELWSVEPGHGE